MGDGGCSCPSRVIGVEVAGRRDVGLHPYVSELALTVMAAGDRPRWVEVDGSLAFFDISGFTPLTERLATVGRAGAEHINDVLNTVFTGLIDVVFHFGGDVLEFGGDAMVVLYTGRPARTRAAAAAAEINRFDGSPGTARDARRQGPARRVVRHRQREPGVLPARFAHVGRWWSPAR